MSTVPDTGAPAPALNPFTADAEERMTRLRAMANDLPDEAEPALLRPSDLRLARRTSPEGLEKAAVFVQAAPEVGDAVASVDVLRDAIAFELAYTGVRDEARAYARRVDMAIMKRKLKAVRAARGVFRMAKSYATVAEGDAIRTHVSDLKRTLGNPRRRKAAAPPDAGTPEVKK